MTSSATVPHKRWTYVIPVAVVMYMLAYLDRTNVALILPFIGKELPLSASATGLASGIFFVGYLVLQIPAAILAARWSARKTVLILMVAWSVAAVLCGLVHTEGQLYRPGCCSGCSRVASGRRCWYCWRPGSRRPSGRGRTRCG